jgi:uridine kinase
MSRSPKIIAITGGSGCGKSWLAGRLQEHFGVRAARVSLDDFYRDRSHIAPARRLRVNYDHPDAIDWELFEGWLGDYRKGTAAALPKYDFQTHTRLNGSAQIQPTPLLLIEGLWLLRRPTVRKLIDFSVFIECPEAVRLERRENRDVAERGRSPISVRRQFADFVAPMHERYVAPQMRWADLVLAHPIAEADVYRLAVRLSALLAPQREVPLWMTHARVQDGRRTCSV